MTQAKSVLWQPVLEGELIRLRPLREDDFEQLHQAASDPLVWEQHPEKERYRRENFERFFRSGIDSKGALVVIDQRTGNVIGSSRFTDQKVPERTIEIGYTFLAREFWGGGYNRELKKLMLDYAFRFVDQVFFFVGETNGRSQKAVGKIGAKELKRVTTQQLDGKSITSVVYQITKAEYVDRHSSKS